MLFTTLITASLVLAGLTLALIRRSRQAQHVRIPVRIDQPARRRIDHENH